VVPESLNSFETGGDLIINNRLKTTLSVYYSEGMNFMYYVNTGDSIELSNGLRPIYVSTNIPRVRIGGVETEISYTVNQNIVLTGSFSYSNSLITDYAVLDETDPIDLTGNYLTDVPSHVVALAGRWNNKIVNLSITGRYQGAMWVNDQNIFDDIVGSDRYPAYFICDLQMSKEIRFINLTFGVQNLFNEKFYDSGGDVCPGRFITVDLGVKF